jgi:cell division protease FtsH
LASGQGSISMDMVLAVLSAEGEAEAPTLPEGLLRAAKGLGEAEVKSAELQSAVPFDAELKRFLSAEGMKDELALEDVLRWRGSSAPPPAKDAPPAPAVPLSSEVATVRSIEVDLGKVILGQEGAIASLVQGFYLGMLRGEERGRPLSMVFFGDSGVGKSSLASAFGSLVAQAFGGDYAFLGLDMGNYKGTEGRFRLLGNPLASPGQLTTHLARHPKAIVLLDEFDRADSEVLDALLPFLDRGFVEDDVSKQQIRFTGATFLLTTNKGSALYLDDLRYGKLDSRDLPQALVREALLKEMSRSAYAFIDRVSYYCLFRPLGVETLMRICSNEISAWKGSWSRRGVEVSIDDEASLASALVLGLGRAQSARSLKGAVETFMGRYLAGGLLEERESRVNSVTITVSKHEALALGQDASPLSFALIDDEAARFAPLAEKRLARDGGIDASCVPCADPEALEKALRSESRDIAFVLLDLNMGSGLPSADIEIAAGLEPRFAPSLAALKRIREAWPELPVYIYSGLERERYPRLFSYFITVGGVRGFIPKGGGEEAWAALGASVRQRILAKSLERRTRGGRSLEYVATKSRTASGLEVVLSDYVFKQSPTAGDAELFVAQAPNRGFSDIVGAEEAKERFREAIAFLKEPESFLSEGVSFPAGYLLFGPPGTGKTSLAKAVASEGGVPFIEASIGQFKNKFYGETEERVRTLFRVARRYAPVVVFIDELDSLGSRSRESSSDRMASELITEFLQCLDGFSDNRGVIFIAATNDKDAIDPALLRPGRFGTHILVDLPRRPAERAEILRLNLRRRRGLDPAEIDALASKFSTWTSGLSPASIERVVDEAFAIARRRRVESGAPPPRGPALPPLETFIEARNAVVFGRGERADDPRSAGETALHEAGHAVMSRARGRPILQVSIVGRGMAAGFLERVMEGFDDSRDGLLGQIDILLGGRCAEELCLESGRVSAGASSDLDKATRAALDFIYRFGLLDGRELASLGCADTASLLLQVDIRQKVNALLGERRDIVMDLLRGARPSLERLTAAIVEKETLLGEEVEAILGGGQ